MGDHSKPKAALLRRALAWAKAHPKVVSSVVVGVVGVITAVRPDFPGAAVIAMVRAVVGA